MASIREQILVKIKELHSQASVTIGGTEYTKPTGLNVHRSRTRPVEKDELPASLIYALEEDPEDASHDLDTGRKLRVLVEHRAQSEPVDTALDPLITWGNRVMMADHTLGGLAVAVRDRGIEWKAAELDKQYGVAGQLWEVEYFTAEDDPEASA